MGLFDKWKKTAKDTTKGDAGTTGGETLTGPGLFTCPAECGLADIININDNRPAVCPKCGAHLKSLT